MKTWAQQLYHFYTHFTPGELPNHVAWLFPQRQPEVRKVVKAFLDKYYNDRNERRLLLGINPGRFGAGVTGVNFTAPKQLTEVLSIPHPFKSQSELSAEFIYDLIAAYGGPEAFFGRHFIGSVCPLGFVKGGKNINYYDDPALLAAVEPFIIESIETQLRLPVDRSACGCIGEDKNFKYLSKLNERFGWFDRIAPLPHPRFVMQYRRREKEQFIDRYLQFLH
ncbi:uracil-DNA glycosylase family protein [Flaviaesturariibacter amylovorans]|uniref:SMUG2 DNA glycosylase family protein n=1 Tax=Flaviaesturariibacter amylovorans TaxID=1084520 RepID=A0ABP8HH87_9BACT